MTKTPPQTKKRPLIIAGGVVSLAYTCWWLWDHSRPPETLREALVRVQAAYEKGDSSEFWKRSSDSERKRLNLSQKHIAFLCEWGRTATRSLRKDGDPIIEVGDSIGIIRIPYRTLDGLPVSLSWQVVDTHDGIKMDVVEQVFFNAASVKYVQRSTGNTENQRLWASVVKTISNDTHQLDQQGIKGTFSTLSTKPMYWPQWLESAKKTELVAFKSD